jgi:hypothetical protein
LLEAGFLSARLHNRQDGGRIGDAALELIQSLQSKDERTAADRQKALVGLLTRGWRQFRSGNAEPGEKRSGRARS